MPRMSLSNNKRNNNMKVVEKIKMLWHDSEETNLCAIKGEKGSFDLMIGEFVMGTLVYSDGNWTYSYSDAFKSQNEYAPLINFPDVNKVYKSDQLWPFFASRIPGMSQLKESSDDKTDIVTLLRKYGQHVVANPYVLISLP